MEQLGFAIIIIIVSICISTLLAWIALNRRDKQIVVLKERLTDLEAWSDEITTKYNEHIAKYHERRANR